MIQMIEKKECNRGMHWLFSSPVHCAVLGHNHIGGILKSEQVILHTTYPITVCYKVFIKSNWLN